MRRALFVLALMFAPALSLWADCVAGKEASVVASSIVDVRGRILKSGVLTITPIDKYGNAINFRSGTGKAITRFGVTASVVNGAIAELVCIPRSDVSSVYVRYHMVVKDSSANGTNAVAIDTTQVPITSDVFSLDTYDYPADTIPASGSTALSPGTVSGDLYITGTLYAGTVSPAMSISVGSVTTLAPEASASVTDSGVPGHSIFNFAIPRGIAGANGADGTSASVTVGSIATGEPGSSAVVTNSGTSNAAVLNFTIPRGADGTGGVPAGTNGDLQMSNGAALAVSGTTSDGLGALTTKQYNGLRQVGAYGSVASALTASGQSAVMEPTYSGSENYLSNLPTIASITKGVGLLDLRNGQRKSIGHNCQAMSVPGGAIASVCDAHAAVNDYPGALTGTAASTEENDSAHYYIFQGLGIARDNQERVMKPNPTVAADYAEGIFAPMGCSGSARKMSTEDFQLCGYAYGTHHNTLNAVSAESVYGQGISLKESLDIFTGDPVTAATGPSTVYFGSTFAGDEAGAGRLLVNTSQISTNYINSVGTVAEIGGTQAIAVANTVPVSTAHCTVTSLVAGQVGNSVTPVDRTVTLTCDLGAPTVGIPAMVATGATGTTGQGQIDYVNVSSVSGTSNPYTVTYGATRFFSTNNSAAFWQGGGYPMAIERLDGLTPTAKMATDLWYPVPVLGATDANTIHVAAPVNGDQAGAPLWGTKSDRTCSFSISGNGTTATMTTSDLRCAKGYFMTGSNAVYTVSGGTIFDGTVTPSFVGGTYNANGIQTSWSYSFASTVAGSATADVALSNLDGTFMMPSVMVAGGYPYDPSTAQTRVDLVPNDKTFSTTDTWASPNFYGARTEGVYLNLYQNRGSMGYGGSIVQHWNHQGAGWGYSIRDQGPSETFASLEGQYKNVFAIGNAPHDDSNVTPALIRVECPAATYGGCAAANGSYYVNSLAGQQSTGVSAYYLHTWNPATAASTITTQNGTYELYGNKRIIFSSDQYNHNPAGGLGYDLTTLREINVNAQGAPSSGVNDYQDTPVFHWGFSNYLDSFSGMSSGLRNKAWLATAARDLAFCVDMAGTSCPWLFSANGALTSTGTINGASPTEMSYLSGVTGAIQAQLDSKASGSSSTTVNGVTCALGGTCTIPTSASQVAYMSHPFTADVAVQSVVTWTDTVSWSVDTNKPVIFSYSPDEGSPSSLGALCDAYGLSSTQIAVRCRNVSATTWVGGTDQISYALQQIQ